jgi:hypothetical protein
LWPGLNAFFQKIFPNLFDARGSYFLGFATLGVIIFALWHWLKRKNLKAQLHGAWNSKNDVMFWGMATIVFYFFSLGISFSIGKVTIYLPYFLVYKLLPFYENIRTTGRMFVFVLLGVSMLFAYAYLQLLKRHGNKKMLMTGALALLILLEFWVAPVKTMTISHSVFYEKIAKDSEQYKLLEIPGSTNYGFASYALYTDTIHKKPVLNGMPLARKISKQFAMQQETPVIKQLLFTIPKGGDGENKKTQDIVANFDWNLSNELLNYYNVRYITISKKYASKNVVKAEESFISKHIVTADHYEDQDLIAYQIANTSFQNDFYVLFGGEEYSKLIAEDGKSARILGDGAQIKIVNMSQIAQKVQITLDAKNSNAPLVFSLGSSQKEVAANTFGQYVFTQTIASGENVFKFNVADQQGKNVKMSNRKGLRGGLVVSNIQITKE